MCWIGALRGDQQDLVLQWQTPGAALANRVHTRAPQSDDQLAELTWAQTGERGCPGRLRRRPRKVPLTPDTAGRCPAQDLVQPPFGDQWTFSSQIDYPFGEFSRFARMGDIWCLRPNARILAISVSCTYEKGGHSLPGHKVVE